MPRALRIRPMEAAVMPLPSELVTPPVTKTYFGIARAPLPVAQACLRKGTREHRTPTPYSGGQSSAPMPSMPAAIRLIHPAPALAVVALSAALGAILARQAGVPTGERWALTVLAVAGSQVFTGATNDIADRFRHATVRAGRLLPAGDVRLNAR